MDKAIKVGVQAGAGPQPGYIWSVYYLSLARDDASSFLDESQYGHAADLVKALATEENPTQPKTVEVEKVESFYELKDKGGILGKINLRIFFDVVEGSKSLLVLAAIKKESEGKTPEWARVRVRSRLRKFKAGEFGDLPAQSLDGSRS